MASKDKQETKQETRFEELVGQVVNRCFDANNVRLYRYLTNRNRWYCERIVESVYVGAELRLSRGPGPKWDIAPSQECAVVLAEHGLDASPQAIADLLAALARRPELIDTEA